jgi:hypothetical protein
MTVRKNFLHTVSKHVFLLHRKGNAVITTPFLPATPELY